MTGQLISFHSSLERFTPAGGWHFVRVPREVSLPLLDLADRGVVVIEANVGHSTWLTFLQPIGDGSHFVAVPAKVRRRERMKLGDRVTVSCTPSLR